MEKNVIKAILACDDTGGVSKDGTLPWPNNSTDLKWFKENTAGHFVVMGSTTWEDPHMPRPLPKRVNVLCTSRKEDYYGAHLYLNGDLKLMIKELAFTNGEMIIWIIGGPKIIEQTMDIIDEFYLSRIPGEYDCDNHLNLDEIYNAFDLDWEENHPEVNFQIWKRK